MSRQTVTLSDETTTILNAYVKARGGTNSSAISNIVSAALDEWLIIQDTLGRNVLKGVQLLDLKALRIVSQLTEIISKNCNNLGINTSREAQDLFLNQTLKEIVPDTFNQNQRNAYRNLIANYAFETPYFKSWPNKHQLSKYIQLPLNQVSFEDIEVVYKLIAFYNNEYDSALIDTVSNKISKFKKDYPNGKIVIIGKTGFGKTTLQIDIAREFGLSFWIHELNDIEDFINLDRSEIYVQFGDSIQNAQKRFLNARIEALNSTELTELDYDLETPETSILFLQVNYQRKSLDSKSKLMPSVIDTKIVEIP